MNIWIVYIILQLPDIYIQKQWYKDSPNEFVNHENIGKYVKTNKLPVSIQSYLLNYLFDKFPKFPVFIYFNNVYIVMETTLKHIFVSVVETPK